MGGFDVGSILAHLNLDGSGFKSVITASTKDVASFKVGVESVGKALAKWGAISLAAGAAVGAAFGAIIGKTANAGDAINDMSKRTGIATETLSSYKLAAEKSGTSLEGLAVGLRGLATNMQAATVAGSAEAKIFSALGINVLDGTGKLRSLDDVMLGVADRFQQMGDTSERTVLATKIFGRAGMDLIPLLSQGAAGLKEEADRARELGLVFSGPAAAACDRFNDAMADLKGAVTGIRNDIGIALIPVARQFIEGMSSGLVVLSKEIAKFTASGQLGAWAATVARGFISAFKLMAKAVEGLILLLPSLKAAVFSVAEGFYKTLGKISEGISVIPGISAHAAVALKVWASDLKGFSETYGKAADENIEKASSIVEGFEALFKAVDAVAAGFGKMVPPAKEAAKGILEAFDPVMRQLGEFSKLTPWKRGSMIEPIPMNLVASELPSGRDLSWLVGAVKDTAEKAGSVWKDFTEDLKFRWGNTIADVLDGTKSLADGMIDLFKIIKREFLEIVANTIAKALAGIVTDILQLAGVIKADTVGLIGGAGAAIGQGIGAAGAGTVITNTGAIAGTAESAASSAAFAGTIDTAMAGGILAGMSGTAVLGAVGFAAVWLGKVFGTLFGKTAADRMYDAWASKMKQEYGTNWEAFMRHDITKSSLKDTSPSPGPVVDYGPAKNVSGGGAYRAGSEGSITLNFQISALDGADVNRVVRDKVIPILRRASANRAFLTPTSAVGGA